MYTRILLGTHHCPKCGYRVKLDAASCNYCGNSLTSETIRGPTRYEESLAVVFLTIAIVTLLEAINANPFSESSVDSFRVVRWATSLAFYVLTLLTVGVRRYPNSSFGCLLIASLLSVPDYYGIAGLVMAIPLWMSRSAFLPSRSSFGEDYGRGTDTISHTGETNGSLKVENRSYNDSKNQFPGENAAHGSEQQDKDKSASKFPSDLIELIPFVLFIALVIFAIWMRT